MPGRRGLTNRANRKHDSTINCARGVQGVFSGSATLLGRVGPKASVVLELLFPKPTIISFLHCDTPPRLRLQVALEPQARRGVTSYQNLRSLKMFFPIHLSRPPRRLNNIISQ